jgi:DeoR family transcriptional regulator of aga operon
MMASENGASARRAQVILEQLLQRGDVAVKLLARQLGVTAATIRRDLTALEKQGLLRRTHGGAAPVMPPLYEPFRHTSSFQEQEAMLAAEKRRIGLAAAALVKDGDVVSLGAGTTATCVARSLRHRRNLTIVTNAVNIAMELSHQDNLRVYVTGGRLSGSWFALVGEAALATARETFVDKAFIGVDGIHAECGLTTNYPEQAPIHRVLFSQARQKIVVADHRKLGVIGTSLIASTADVTLLITDKRATEKQLSPFLNRGIRVHRA